MSDVTEVTTNPVVDKSMRKVALLQAAAQLDMLIEMFGEAPERVKKSGVEFRDALKEWAEQ